MIAFRSLTTKASLLFFFAFVASSAFAFEVPALTGPVVDEAELLDASTIERIGQAARYLKTQGGSQIQVLTVKSLDGIPIEQASIQVTDKWKLGTSKGDRGVLLFISRDDRKIRIEVGQGNEGDLTDAQSKRIIEDVITPYFKQSDFDSGIAAGFLQIARITDPGIDIGQFFGRRVIRQSQGDGGDKGIGFWVFAIFILFVLFGGFFGGGRRRRYYGGWGGGLGGGGFGGGGGLGGGGGGGGGGWSGGGGGFSGGGASGGW